MRAVVVFCEGRHDVVFVSRSLGVVARGRWFDKTIGDLPAPFGSSGGTGVGCIETQYRRSPLGALRLTAAAHSQAPTFEAMIEVPEQGLVVTPYFLVRCNGADAVGLNRNLIDNITGFIEGGFSRASGVDEVAFAFILDADDDGVEARERGFAAAYSDCLSSQPIQHGGWVEGPHGPVGLFVFHDLHDTKRAGTLEDALAPLVGQQWPTRWDAADAYLRQHAEAGDRIHRKRADYTKARIGVTGQFLFPGDAMTEVIGRKGLADAHFTGPVSQALVDFLRAVPW